MPKNNLVDKNQNLIKTLAAGAIWITVGMMIARVLGYAVRAAIARFYGMENYGIVNTALSMMMLVTIFSLAGLNTGLPRQISFYRARKDLQTVYHYILSALKLGSLFGLIGGALLYFSADFLAREYFKNQELALFLKIFALGIPLFILFELNTSVFKGFRRMANFSFLHDVLRFAIILLFILALGLWGLPFHLTGYAYIISYSAIILITFFWIWKKGFLQKPAQRQPGIDGKLLRFSVPLMFSGIFWLVIPRTDTILIGGFLDQQAVGIYNAAVPVGQLILIVRQAFTPIILPLFTELLSTNRNEELSLLYYISAKWVAILALPVFITIASIPDFFLIFIYGKEALVAAPILRIVLVGYLVHTVVGPTSNLLIISGKTRLAMINSGIAFLISFSLNLILIPRMGIVGAAISSVLAYVTFNLLSYVEVYYTLKIQPFRLLHLKFVLAALLPAPVFFLLHLPGGQLLNMVVYSLVYLALLFVLRAFKAEDKVLLNALRRRK